MPNQELLINGPQDSEITVILAHGAGAPMDSPFMNEFADGLANANFQVVRFEFPYMAERRQSGTQRPPNKQVVLLETRQSRVLN